MQEHGTVWCCTDCALWSANADDSGAAANWSPAQYDAGIRELTAGGQRGWLVLSMADQVDEDGEDMDENGIITFSDMQCNVCLSRLAGTRYRAIVVSA